MKQAKGDIIELALEGHFDVIAHGCNCQNIMGIGLAKQIKERFPEAELADYKFWKLNGKNKNEMLGNFSSVLHTSNERPFAIANLYTQLRPGPDFQLRYLKWCLNSLFEKFGDVEYAFPMIGCNYEGGNPEEVKQLIKELSINYNVTIIHLP